MKSLEKIKEQLISNKEIKPSPDGRFQDCWYWTKGYSNNSGAIWIINKNYRVSRVSAWIFQLKDPNGEFYTLDNPYRFEVCHKCDNSACHNPEHLFVDTHKANAKDMVDKRRSLKGSKHNNTKLTEELVLEMRELFTDGWTIGELKDKFEISYATATRIVKRVTWTHC